ncbi:iron uptake system protein EfeO [Falsarthrobacter nasiphocae]|uniref:Iron uptake system component EfeO n=1 Tax=Falsarthrobacter nasiphocae TaxID=189863 RepID=A0AAE3YIP6_9MICC|nr:iron uptake system protein EfeO [Falsarthrobacter nasiphocae]MDR6892471.1 iron uptake system component EfeO [Falsarthrobacter nasiphocae]
MNRALRRATPAVALLALLATGCTDNRPQGGASGAPGTISVTSTKDACTLSTTTARSGTLTFSVKNEGTDVTEFYLLADDGLRIVGEVENIGPGLTRELVVQAQAGTYKTACKPGMVGSGIRGDFTVEKSGDEPVVSADDKKLADTASANYAAYVKEQTEQLLAGTKRFADAYKAGRDEEARSLYAKTRLHWERIEPVAESFGDLDPQLDAREADLEKGQEWTGWHRAEKDLWAPKGFTPQSSADRAKTADKLVKDTEELAKRTKDLSFTPDQLGNGAKALLDEVASGKVTGEEEAFSHTDLWDFQGNLDGAKVAYEELKPLLLKRNKDLADQLDRRFAATQKELDKYRQGDGWVSYEILTKDQVKALSTSVDGLAEPLSKLTKEVVAK